MQQINLYQYLPKPIKSLLDPRSLMILCGVYCSVLLLSSLISLIGRHSDNVRLNASQAAYINAQHRLVAIATKYPSSEIQLQPPDVAKLAYCKVRFSKYLTALGDALVPGVALTTISISDHGAVLALKGNAIVEDQAQKYVESLKKQPALANLVLILQDITRGTEKDPKSPYITFNIATKMAAAHA